MARAEYVKTPQEVIDAERAIIEGRRGAPLGPDSALWGLALSGGGIRSAAFNLGLLQALGDRGVLAKCDYLSTVSGGGYIGSCLSALCAPPQVDVTPERFPLGFRPGHERAAVKHLRRHAQYLVPRHGLFRLDTWRLVSAYLGGLVVTLLTSGALLGVVGALGIVAYPHIVNWLTRGRLDSLPSLTRFWDEPQSFALELLMPAIVSGAVWLALVALNTLAGRWLLSRWTLERRRGRVRLQGAALMVTVGLAVFGALPFLFVTVANLAPKLVITGSAAALVLTRVLNLGRQAKDIWDRFRKWVLTLGSALFVAVVCLAVLYGVWCYRDYALWIAGACVAVLVVLSLLFDINRVSMFFFYRDRLSEAFVIRQVAEANQRERVVNVDTLPLWQLAYTDHRVPYHLINAAVNLPGSRDPNLYGRQADFFLMSPLYCGSPATGYRDTTIYQQQRVNLASAMAISGAAVNPQHGSATSGALAFLMTILNARLGAWAENPMYPPKTWLWRIFWPWYLGREMLSRMTERSHLVNVSDGGHIENLGVYELLRRRCRVIIASDAGADPDTTFADLGNLVRKARIDLSAYVHLDRSQLAPLVPDAETGLVRAHRVIGQITYRESNGSESHGMLFYVKPGLKADDPVDLHEYRKAHPKFPHEPTADQFFDEAQFESYRELGYQTGKEVAQWPW
jgi:predicted acylesterase/phospholipase RssA